MHSVVYRAAIGYDTIRKEDERSIECWYCGSAHIGYFTQQLAFCRACDARQYPDFAEMGMFVPRLRLVIGDPGMQMEWIAVNNAGTEIDTCPACGESVYVATLPNEGRFAFCNGECQRDTPATARLRLSLFG